MSMTITQWDVERSLRECPPNLLYKPEDGVIFKKRHIINIDNLTFLDEDQPKEQDNQKDNIAALKDSFECNGWIYTQPPLVYEQDGNTNRGKAGFNRYFAIGPDGLNWKSIIVDKVEYSDPLSALIHSIITNDHLPRNANRAKDYAKIVLKAMEPPNGWINNNDKDIKAFIKRIAKSKSSKIHTSIFRIVRGRVSKHQHIKSFDKDSANKWCLDSSLPFSGDKGFDECGKYGYVKPRGTFKSLAHDAMTLLIDTKGKPVFVTGYIENASDDPKTLQEQRQQWINDFKRDVIDFIGNFYQYQEGTLLKNPLKIYPIGFVPQNKTPIPNGTGEIKESGLVDVKGNPKVRTFESILKDHPVSQV